MKEEMQVFKTTTWSPGPGCHGGCGVKVYVKDGKVVKLEGDPKHSWNQGRVCPRLRDLLKSLLKKESSYLETLILLRS